MDVCDEVKGIFREWDINNDGYITFDELSTVFLSLDSNFPVDKLDKLLNACDANRDGHISYEEFLDYLWPSVLGGLTKATMEYNGSMTEKDEVSLIDGMVDTAGALAGKSPEEKKTVDLVPLQIELEEVVHEDICSKGEWFGPPEVIHEDIRSKGDGFGPPEFTDAEKEALQLTDHEKEARLAEMETILADVAAEKEAPQLTDIEKEVRSAELEAILADVAAEKEAPQLTDAEKKARSAELEAIVADVAEDATPEEVVHEDIYQKGDLLHPLQMDKVIHEDIYQKGDLLHRPQMDTMTEETPLGNDNERGEPAEAEQLSKSQLVRERQEAAEIVQEQVQLLTANDGDGVIESGTFDAKNVTKQEKGYGEEVVESVALASENGREDNLSKSENANAGESTSLLAKNAQEQQTSKDDVDEPKAAC